VAGEEVPILARPALDRDRDAPALSALSAVAEAQLAFARNRDVSEALTKLLDGLLHLTECERGFITDAGGLGTRLLVTRDCEPSVVEACEAKIALLMSTRESSPLMGIEHGLLLLPIFGTGDLPVGVAGIAPPASQADRAIRRARPLLLIAGTMIGSRAKLRQQAAHNVELVLEQALTVAIAESSDLVGALQMMLKVICERVGWEIGQAWVPSVSGDVLECLPAWFASAPRFDAVRQSSLDARIVRGGGTGLGKVWQEGQAAWFDITAATNERVRTAIEAGLTLVLMVPILAHGEVIAILEFGSSTPSADSLDRLALVKGAADQVAAQLDRLRLLRERTSFIAALDAMEEGVAILRPYDANGRAMPMHCNAAYLRLRGCKDMDELRVQYAEDRLAKNDPTILRLRRELQQGRAAKAETRSVRPDGSVLEVESSVAPVRDATGAIIMHVVVIRDLGEIRREAAKKKELEAAVATANAAWRQTIDLVEMPIALVDAEGRFRRVNRAGRELLAKSEEELAGRALSEVSAREPWATSGRLVPTVVREGSVAEALAPDIAAGRSWAITLRPAPDLGGVVIVGRDITHTLELQESLQRAETAAALGRIVAGVAHEVRNPLFGIGATLDALEARVRGATEYANYMKVLRGELSRMTALMHDLLDYGRPPRLSPTACALDEVVQDAIERCSKRAGDLGVALLHRNPTEAPTLSIDRARLVQVMINLVDTAVDHSPQGRPS
jgi:PAS domain S-box-containing protein